MMNVIVAQDSQAETRRRVVDTAERLFRDIGYQKTTVADIAKALRMSPANVYRFFDSKKAINEAVAERCMAEVEGELSRIADSRKPAAERLREAIETYHGMTMRLVGVPHDQDRSAFNPTPYRPAMQREA